MTRTKIRCVALFECLAQFGDSPVTTTLGQMCQNIFQPWKTCLWLTDRLTDCFFSSGPAKNHDMQSSSDASLKHGIALATGFRIAEILKTLALFNSWFLCFKLFCCGLPFRLDCLSGLVPWFIGIACSFIELFQGTPWTRTWASTVWSTSTLLGVIQSIRKWGTFMQRCFLVRFALCGKQVPTFGPTRGMWLLASILGTFQDFCLTCNALGNLCWKYVTSNPRHIQLEEHSASLACKHFAMFSPKLSNLMYLIRSACLLSFPWCLRWSKENHVVMICISYKVPVAHMSFFATYLFLRHFDFDPSRFNSPEAEGFRRVLRSVAGMSTDCEDSLLSSLPSELTFNDLRDASKRSRKSQTVQAEDLHTMAAKSCMRRNMACSILDVADQDWGTPMVRKSIKTTVFQALRQSDISLGISSEGLTRHKINHVLTKPHILTQRLEVFSSLLDFFQGLDDSVEDKSDAVMKAFQKGWVAELVPLHWCVGFLDEEVGPERNCAMVLRDGPVHLLCVWLTPKKPGEYGFLHGAEVKPFRLHVDNMENLRVCKATPSVGEQQLCWKLGEWMELKDYLADFGMLEISASLLAKVCSTLKIRGHSKLNHRRKVELFLEWMGRSPDFIAEILEQLPEHAPRKRKEKEDWVLPSLYHLCAGQGKQPK